MDALTAAEQRLFEAYGLLCERRRVRLVDPPLEIGVLDHGAGPPVVLVHGSGMSAATWAPLLRELPDRRAIAIDLPGFGHSDPYDYSGRSLREHAVVQMTSALDALGLERAAIAGTSLGGMWALCFALDAPQRVSAVVSLGMPAVAFPGVHADPFFTAMTLPGVGRVVAKLPPPPTTGAARRAMGPALGRGLAKRLPDAFIDVLRAGMARPGWGQAMWSHLNLALRGGRARPGNALRPEELRAITAPVVLVWGDADFYGPPQLATQATALMPNARVELLPGGHAPFLDEPARCAQIIREASADVQATPSVATAVSPGAAPTP